MDWKSQGQMPVGGVFRRVLCVSAVMLHILGLTAKKSCPDLVSQCGWRRTHEKKEMSCSQPPFGVFLSVEDA